MLFRSVMGQIILAKSHNSGNRVAREIFMNTDSTHNIIIKGNISHFYGVIETGKYDGQVQSMKQVLELHKTDQIGNRTLKEYIKVQSDSRNISKIYRRPPIRNNQYTILYPPTPTAS